MMNEIDELAYLGSDPGAVKHGNFINYYKFHSTEQRTSNFDHAMFPKNDEKILCLDIGCNSGELTKEFYSYLKSVYTNNECHMLGIDIDPKLIERANENNNQSEIKYVCLNIMSENKQFILKDYLKEHKREKFDFIFCFSITMWIHLNNGDSGLQKFLQLMTELSKSVIIEPQPWKCYRNAQRRITKSGSNFPLYKDLAIRSNVEAYIEQQFINLKYKKIYQSSPSSWQRTIQCFSKV